MIVPLDDRVQSIGSKRLKSYNDVLDKIFIAGAVNKNALFNPSISQRQINGIINTALENGHIDERIYIEYYGKIKRKHRYYSITAAGVNFLSKQKTKSWYRYLPSNLNYISNLHPSRKQNEFAFDTRCGNTLIFAIMMGAHISDYPFTGVIHPTADDFLEGFVPAPEMSDEEYRWWETLDSQGENSVIDDEVITPEYIDLLADEDSQSYPDNWDDELFTWEPTSGTSAEETAKPKAKRANSYREIKSLFYHELISNGRGIDELLTTEHKNLFFFASKEMRNILLNSGIGKYSDFKYSQFTGILVSEQMSMIVYHAHHDGIGWADRIESTDIRTMRQFSVKFSPIDNVRRNNIHGSILIYDKKNFADIVNNNFEKRKKGTVLGKSFDTMHLIPISDYGVQLLLWIMMNSPDSKRRYINATVNKLYPTWTINLSVYHKLFAFKDMHDVFIFDGTDFDARKMQYINKEKEKTPSLSFKVLCFEWQEPYYKELWPQVELCFIDKE